MTRTDTGPPGHDEARFRALYERTYAAVLRFVERRTHPTHAEDVTAEVFLVAWRRLDAVPADPDESRVWLFAVAQRTLANARRADQRRQSLTMRIADDQLIATSAASLEPDLIAQQVDLARAWRLLSPVHQESLALAAWDGLSAPEAAVVLDISPVAYRLRLSRARRALRAHLRALPDHAPSPTAHTAPTRSTS